MKEEEKKWDIFRGTTLNFNFYINSVIAISYTVKECLEPLIMSGEKLYFEQANGYLSAYIFCGAMLSKLKKEYKSCIPERHDKLFKFYSNVLNNENDRLRFLTEEDKKEIKEGCLSSSENGVPF